MQLSLSGQIYDDPPTRAINGQLSNITLLSLAPSLKYRAIHTEQLALALQGSVELLSLSSPIFNTGNGEELSVIGSVQTPITYSASPQLQLHITPGVSFFPSTLNQTPFYSTLLTLGTGLSWQPSERWLVYSTLNLPIGFGGNAIDSDQSIVRQPVWALGARYNITPKTGLNLYATNGFGVTPATGILTAIPRGEDLLLGVELNYTPDTGLGYRSSFDDRPSAPLSDRDRQMLLNGITLTTANTLAPGNVSLNAGVGTNSNYGLGLAYSADENLQLEAIFEDFGTDNSVTAANSAGDSFRYMFGTKLRFFNQFQGDPVSLAARILGGRDTDPAQTTGVLFADLSVTYQANARMALFNPKVATFSHQTTVGLGLGMNYEVAQGLQLIGEFTPVFGGDRPVWALGTRYSFPSTAVSLDLYSTNAIGRNGLGTLVGQSGAQFGIGLTWMLGN
ncbi:MAG: hypothetical protein HC800_16335 [Phormidesmis sp. RL_2_1]|nr:hypothetical protein [Phormidesmis sp. RL_2_1]